MSMPHRDRRVHGTGTLWGGRSGLVQPPSRRVAVVRGLFHL